MAKFIATIKAIFTRIIFGAHGAIAIWQVTQYKKNPIYWTLSTPIGLLALEGIFTLAIKKNQEWRWFCPSVFLYLSSVVPAIWLLELDKVEKRHKIQEDTAAAFSLAAAAADLKELDKLLGVNIKLPELNVDAETWVMLIEQFLMLILIIGRWLLPKGDLTRDQLSQLLLVYIGTAADIIEFFDSFKDNKIADEQILVFLTLSIWSWSLLQFTIVLTATRARKPRGASSHDAVDEESNTCCSDCCCSIDIWGIALNIILQDAPFLTFRLLIIIHYKIISYMNVFFTCKNTLVILLQLYRLYVVFSETKKSVAMKKKIKSKRKDTGYGTAGSSYEDKKRKGDKKDKRKSRKDDEDSEKPKKRRSRESSKEEEETRSKRHSKKDKIVEETESESDSASERSQKKKSKKKRSSSSSSSSSD
ncbi:transmembrane protein 26 [Chironomus tepperi]|uniref:transmembrane protein 26 n=1 Tax=Chironomus tepperi TaxID=113505 RepID=UPI00391FB031